MPAQVARNLLSHYLAKTGRTDHLLPSACGMPILQAHRRLAHPLSLPIGCLSNILAATHIQQAHTTSRALTQAHMQQLHVSRAQATTGANSTIPPTGIIDTYAGGLRHASSSPTNLAMRPTDVVVDGPGRLLISDGSNSILWLANLTTHDVTTFGPTITAGQMAIVAGNGTSGFSGDGGPATVTALAGPQGLAVDSAGNLFIVDFFNSRIREVVAATGVITTIVGNGTYAFGGDGGPATVAALANPGALAVDSAGNLFIADSNNNRIREVVATGVITTVAGNGEQAYSGDGGPATAAALYGPQGLAVDSAGNLFIADYFNDRIREVAAATGVITTVAGNGTNSFSGDGGPATAAALGGPAGLAVDSAGNLFIADYFSNRIREVVAATGVITTVAGNGTNSFSGDGGPATIAELADPLA